MLHDRAVFEEVSMTIEEKLAATASALVTNGKGILAIDETDSVKFQGSRSRGPRSGATNTGHRFSAVQSLAAKARKSALSPDI